MELIERDRGCKRDGAPLPSGKVSSELAKFAADFEAKILQPLREKRAVSDEILAIQPVPLGVSLLRKQFDFLLLLCWGLDFSLKSFAV